MKVVEKSPTERLCMGGSPQETRNVHARLAAPAAADNLPVMAADNLPVMALKVMERMAQEMERMALQEMEQIL